MNNNVLKAISIFLGVLTLVMVVFFLIYNWEYIFLALIPGLLGVALQRFNNNQKKMIFKVLEA